jgi:hypothetical protein
MKKAENYIFAGLVLIAGLGCLLQGYIGGLITGFSLTLFIAASTGKYLADKITTTIGKHVHDHLVN